jgi:Ca2+-binding RTX toxin-like protein
MLTRLATALGLAMVLSTVAGVAQASVGTSCSFDAGTATVTATIGSAASATLIRNGTSIQFDGSFCGLATVTNTEHIDIDAPDATTTESLTISLAGGTFTDGANEIAIAANLSQTEPLAFVGTSGPDDFSIRSSQANLNADTTNTFEVTYPIGSRTITVDGGPGADIIATQAYQVAVFGGGGNDTIEPADAGTSTYDGGSEDDVISYMNGSNIYATGLTVQAHDSTNATIDRGNGAKDTTKAIETIIGASTSDSFYGSPDANHFIGGDGNDRFMPLGGNDVIDGGPGLLDTFSVASSWNPVAFDLTAQTAIGEGSDTFIGIEGLEGDLGNDSFVGDPTVHGFIRIDGGGGSDVLDLRTAAEGQTVYLSGAYITPPAALWAVRVPRIIGSPLRDRFFFYAGDVPAHFLGGKGSDRLVGGPLDDKLNGGAGNDRILGKVGTDTCNGGPGMNTITGCELP